VHGDIGGQAGKAGLHTATLEERAGVDAGHILAACLDVKLDRLEDPRAHRSVGDREHVQTVDVAVEHIGVRSGQSRGMLLSTEAHAVQL
jgi:hypothetical protein